MKPIKLFLLFTLALLAFSVESNAQLRKKTTAPVEQGQFIDFGVSVKDTLAVSDTIAYIIPINHTNKVYNYLTFNWTKIGAGTATLDAQFFQSNNGTDWFALTAGSAQTTYTKTYTLSATGANQANFATDSVNFSGRYLKIQYKTSNTSSVSGSIASRLKTYFE